LTAAATAAFGVGGHDADEQAFKVATLDAPAGSAVTRLRVTGEENPARVVVENADVGIGTGSPGAKLHVAGNARIDAALDMSGSKIVNLAAPTDPADAASKEYVDGLSGGSYRFVAESVPTSNTNSVTFSGLDGDADVWYVIQANFKNNGGLAWYELRPNGVTSGLKSDVIYRIDGDSGVSGGTESIWRILLFCAITGSGGSTEVKVYAKSGSVRSYTAHAGAKHSGSPSNNMSVHGGHWSDTTTNLTSLTIVGTNSAAIGGGSVIRLYKLTRSRLKEPSRAKREWAEAAAEGSTRCVEWSSGVTVRELVEPSARYLEALAAHAASQTRQVYEVYKEVATATGRNVTLSLDRLRLSSKLTDAEIVELELKTGARIRFLREE
jgi:hypothetical protein